jgi:hypothetical protein
LTRLSLFRELLPAVLSRHRSGPTGARRPTAPAHRGCSVSSHATTPRCVARGRLPCHGRPASIASLCPTRSSVSAKELPGILKMHAGTFLRTRFGGPQCEPQRLAALLPSPAPPPSHDPCRTRRRRPRLRHRQPAPAAAQLHLPADHHMPALPALLPVVKQRGYGCQRWLCHQRELLGNICRKAERPRNAHAAAQQV